MTMIDLRYIKKLIEMLDGSTVDSVEISSDKGMKLRISKSPHGRAAVQVATPLQVPAIMATQQPQVHNTPPEAMTAIPEPAGSPPPEPRKQSLSM
jgi:acetyl-CoA carboxylase biotin carboxyl carrier protein